ncbi:hypothetical protein N7499_013271 [Penicillium canescens]|uniref:Zn(2)-C6 fungal-type domain-containing protein n=1 Tax=Penicillium canescens TaxID=5083 RepID=A0AAD6I583_PENCN|nr:uncharacterized protein N7446_000077 [Penicillium canescens]KAJ6011755.1 hypothetical protein N7522_002110 [Penicillium canescens]KAJ6030856.1 hypothetical protein N7460_011122 [Penicillium canescens]KAJ6064591.1 hypothetical protein N7499_013271 [Penicillium canescens]KAJ6077141.1 hypothetical protein N7446_000077 [Penicillium canescens]KAJ6153910.1 hypothetical protein N7485_012279 [Penicillium canescens]
MSSKRSRLVAGCQRCRVRHLKCDLNDQDCGHCQHAGVECDRTNIRFRNGLLLPKEPELAFPDQSSWPQLHGQVRFHNETPEIASLYSAFPHGQSTAIGNSEYGLALGERERPESRTVQQSIQPFAATALTPIPARGAESHSPSASPLSSPRPIQSRSSSKPLYSLTEREAVLMRNYVENMALWADITDPQRHFETEVPARALNEPFLRYAVFAFSSRHLDRQDGSDVTEALQHHNCCVQLLIPALSEPREHITEDILATVAILRQHEEMDGEDNQFHLTGTTHILNTVSTFGSSGGLGEAAAWLCLRQDIYISLTTQRPLRTDLQSFYQSDVFRRNDDFAWSSRMVFLLAKVLQSAFTDSATAHGIGAEIDEWYSTKPYTFEPVRSVPRGPEPDQRFPTIWMLLPVHVIGIQYFHLAKIVLALSEGSNASSAYESLRHSRIVEKIVRHHLLTVLGLAHSNSKAENTLFTARHSLVAWGWVLRHRLDQRAAEALLQAMHARTGWNMDSLIQSLRAQWQEVDDN